MKKAKKTKTPWRDPSFAAKVKAVNKASDQREARQREGATAFKACKEIVELMSGNPWSADTTAEIAVILRNAGWTIKDVE